MKRDSLSWRVGLGSKANADLPDGPFQEIGPLGSMPRSSAVILERMNPPG
mgnify:CR=1 FL=1